MCTPPSDAHSTGNTLHGAYIFPQRGNSRVHTYIFLACLIIDWADENNSGCNVFLIQWDSRMLYSAVIVYEICWRTKVVEQERNT